MLNELLDPTEGDQYDLQGPDVSLSNPGAGITEKSYVWTYKNSKDQDMDITITFETEEGENPKIIVAFGMANIKNLSKYDTMTGAGDLPKILRTIVGAAEYVIDEELGGDKNSLVAVGFKPSDRSRERIYDQFMKQYFSKFEEPVDIEVLRNLQLDKDLNWYINKIYNTVY